MHPACVSFAVKEHFMQWGKQSVWAPVAGISLGPACGLSCVCLAEPLSPAHFADLFLNGLNVLVAGESIKVF